MDTKNHRNFSHGSISKIYPDYPNYDAIAEKEKHFDGIRFQLAELIKSEEVFSKQCEQVSVVLTQILLHLIPVLVFREKIQEILGQPKGVFSFVYENPKLNGNDFAKLRESGLAEGAITFLQGFTKTEIQDLLDLTDSNINLLKKSNIAFAGLAVKEKIWQQMSEIDLDIRKKGNGPYFVFEPFQKIADFLIKVNENFKNKNNFFSDRFKHCIYLSSQYGAFLDLFKKNKTVKNLLEGTLKQKLAIEAFLITPVQRAPRWTLFTSEFKKTFTSVYMKLVKNKLKKTTKWDELKTALTELWYKFNEQAKNLNDCQAALEERKQELEESKAVRAFAESMRAEVAKEYSNKINDICTNPTPNEVFLDSINLNLSLKGSTVLNSRSTIITSPSPENEEEKLLTELTKLSGEITDIKNSLIIDLDPKQINNPGPEKDDEDNDSKDEGKNDQYIIILDPTDDDPEELFNKSKDSNLNHPDSRSKPTSSFNQYDFLNPGGIKLKNDKNDKNSNKDLKEEKNDGGPNDDEKDDREKFLHDHIFYGSPTLFANVANKQTDIQEKEIQFKGLVKEIKATIDRLDSFFVLFSSTKVNALRVALKNATDWGKTLENLSELTVDAFLNYRKDDAISLKQALEMKRFECLDIEAKSSKIVSSRI